MAAPAGPVRQRRLIRLLAAAALAGPVALLAAPVDCGGRPAPRCPACPGRSSDSIRTGPRVGIGFVLQPGNHDQIEGIADYAARAGVDQLDLRKDEVDVTERLDPARLAEAATQLRRARQHAAAGRYGVVIK
jgi:hypothetical protein